VSPTLLLPTSKIIEDSLYSAVADLFEAARKWSAMRPLCSDPYVVSLGAFWAIVENLNMVARLWELNELELKRGPGDVPAGRDSRL
jgi:hypothetical protein